MVGINNQPQNFRAYRCYNSFRLAEHLRKTSYAYPKADFLNRW